MPNKLAVAAAFQVYADALNAGDDQGVRDAFIWPLAHMPADGVVMVDKPPALPSEMRAQTDWAPDFDSSTPEKGPTVNGINNLRAEF